MRAIFISLLFVFGFHSLAFAQEEKKYNYSPSWQKIWTITGAYIAPDSDTNYIVKNLIDKQFIITKDIFKGPDMYPSCPHNSKPSYKSFKEVSLEKVKNSNIIGSYPFSEMPLKNKILIQGGSSCVTLSGKNLSSKIDPGSASFLFDGDTGYVLFEGGAILILK